VTNQLAKAPSLTSHMGITMPISTSLEEVVFSFSFPYDNDRMGGRKHFFVIVSSTNLS